MIHSLNKKEVSVTEQIKEKCERIFYQKITEIYAASIDYDQRSKITKYY